MTSIKLIVTGAKARAQVDGVLTSGAVGIPVTIQYDSAWDGLTKNLVCISGEWGPTGTARTILSVDSAATVAHEVMIAENRLYLGVEGYNADGTLVIPTTWADCGLVHPGADSDADPSADPTLPVYMQLEQRAKALGGKVDSDGFVTGLMRDVNGDYYMETPAGKVRIQTGDEIVQISSMIGDLNQLETDAKSDLVAAINEAAKTGDIGLAGFSPLATVKKSVNGNTVITITDVNGTTTAVVTDGYTPVKGEDYWTDADKAEIKSYVDEAILGGAW